MESQPPPPPSCSPATARGVGGHATYIKRSLSTMDAAHAHHTRPANLVQSLGVAAHKAGQRNG